MSHHVPHLLMLVLPLLAFALFFAAEWRRTASAPLPWDLRAMAVASAGAAGVHAVVTPHHLHEAALLGWFFALLAIAQLAWVVALLVAPGRRVVSAGVLANLGVVLLWAWTRAVGIPFGVGDGARQRFTPADLLATGLEVVVVLAGVAWTYKATGGSPPVSSALSKWERSTTRNSPPPRKTSVPLGSLPSHAMNSLRPSRRSTFATRS